MFKRARIPEKEFQFQLDTMRLSTLSSPPLLLPPSPHLPPLPPLLRFPPLLLSSLCHFNSNHHTPSWPRPLIDFRQKNATASRETSSITFLKNSLNPRPHSLHLLLSYWNLPANIKSGGSVNLVSLFSLPHCLPPSFLLPPSFVVFCLRAASHRTQARSSHSLNMTSQHITVRFLNVSATRL
jgi:hypothetical protein